jgi:hypothetical protein
MAGLVPAMLFWWPSNSTLTLPGLDPGILFAAAEKDRRVKPGEGEGLGGHDERVVSASPPR